VALLSVKTSAETVTNVTSKLFDICYVRSRDEDITRGHGEGNGNRRRTEDITKSLM
jgi:hypothetical protein